MAALRQSQSNYDAIRLAQADLLLHHNPILEQNIFIKVLLSQSQLWGNSLLCQPISQERKGHPPSADLRYGETRRVMPR